MKEQELHDYNKWLMEVWNPNQLYIPFSIDAPKAYLYYMKKIESCNNCKFDKECRHKIMMPEGQKTCKFYIKTC